MCPNPKSLRHKVTSRQPPNLLAAPNPAPLTPRQLPPPATRTPFMYQLSDGVKDPHGSLEPVTTATRSCRRPRVASQGLSP